MTKTPNEPTRRVISLLVANETAFWRVWPACSADAALTLTA